MSLLTSILLLIVGFLIGLVVGSVWTILKLENKYRDRLNQIHNRYSDMWEAKFGSLHPRILEDGKSKVIDIRARRKKQSKKVFCDENKND